MEVNKSSRNRRRFPRVTRLGATAVEFAIVVPIFFLFLLASFEFGWLNVLRHMADNAAYEAARGAMVPGATATEAKATATAILKIVGARDAVITVTPATLLPTTTEITVAIDIPLKNNVLIVPRFTTGKTLHSEATLRTERAN
jgi:Flp pilus assembly protein TadG